MYGDDGSAYAYTYRDYVIKAFNDDTRFDRFIHEQLAADAVEPKVEPWRLAAMGFLTLGRQYDNNIHDVIDDRIDTVTRGFLGLTVACARCHDHKYDAIPTADYYSLYGVFANSQAPLEPPLAETAENCKTLPEYEKLAGPHREKMQKFLDSQYAMLIETAQKRIGDYLLRVATTEPDPAEPRLFSFAPPTDLRPPLSTLSQISRIRIGRRIRCSIRGLGWRRAEFTKDAAAVLNAGANSIPSQRHDWVTGKADVVALYGDLFMKVVSKPAKGQRRNNPLLASLRAVKSWLLPKCIPGFTCVRKGRVRRHARNSTRSP